MKFKMSPNVAIPTKEIHKATEFYTKVLNFSKQSVDQGMVEIHADPIRFFITDDPLITGPVMELFVEDLDSARDYLLSHGCEIIRWHGHGKDCYLKDPFGITYNLWEVKN